MISFLSRVVITVFILALAACSGSEHAAPSGGEKELLGGSQSPGVELNGSDQGREGGHFLICDPILPELASEVDSFSDEIGGKVFVILDYYLAVRNPLYDFKLREFDQGLTATNMLEQVILRLDELFASFSQMEDRMEAIRDFERAYLARHNADVLNNDVFGPQSPGSLYQGKWTRDGREPEEIPLTKDFLVSELAKHQQLDIAKHCDNRFYQAAKFNYCGEDDAFDNYSYSGKFQIYASERQKSFLNVHEMLRFVIRDETPQVQLLTYYFHTEEFFTAESSVIFHRLSGIAQSVGANFAFFQKGSLKPLAENRRCLSSNAKDKH